MLTRSLLVDFYELTMAAGDLSQGKGRDTATFDLYFRHNPFRGGYAIAAGLQPALEAVLSMRFSDDDVAYLGSLRTSTGLPVFPEEFLSYLSGFRFTGSIRAIPEGSVVFPNEPLVQATGNLIECQLIESILLCHVNFQTLVATKAARLWEASNRGRIIEFGLRRAQGPDGALSACRAACVGGADSTSNVLGAALLQIAPRGTHAHSWVQSFPSELEAFRAYARAFPDDCVLLIDTYDVLAAGVVNAITAGKELEANGHRLLGVRIDSGDLAFLSARVREELDRAGLHYVKIVVSNDVDEFVITEVIAQGGTVDIWGVGTNLVTAGGPGGAALGGVYKMVEHNGEPTIKLSGNPEKTTTPGLKQVVRFWDANGLMEADALLKRDDDVSARDLVIIDPYNPLRRKRIEAAGGSLLLEDVVHRGELVRAFPPLQSIRERRASQLTRLHETSRRLHNPHEYKVGLSPALWEQKQRLLRERSL